MLHISLKQKYLVPVSENPITVGFRFPEGDTHHFAFQRNASTLVGLNNFRAQ